MRTCMCGVGVCVWIMYVSGVCECVVYASVWCMGVYAMYVCQNRSVTYLCCKYVVYMGVVWCGCVVWCLCV